MEEIFEEDGPTLPMGVELADEAADWARVVSAAAETLERRAAEFTTDETGRAVLLVDTEGDDPSEAELDRETWLRNRRCFVCCLEWDTDFGSGELESIRYRGHMRVVCSRCAADTEGR